MLAQKLKDARKKRGLYQREVAKKTGLSESYISHLEQGTRPNPSINTLKKLSDLYNMPLSSLIIDENVPINKKLLEKILQDDSISELISVIIKLPEDDIDRLKKTVKSWL